MTTELSAGAPRASRMARMRGGALMVGACLLGTTGQAAAVKYEYRGVVTTAAPETHVAPGASFAGSFTYDPAATPTLKSPGSGGGTQYLYGHALSAPTSSGDASGLDVQVGNQTGYTLIGGLGVTVGPEATGGAVQIGTAQSDPGPLTVALDLKNASHSALTAAAPPALLSLANAPQATFTMTGDANTASPHTLYTGTIESLTLVTPVPEPAAVATWLGLATVSAGVWNRRRRRGGC